MAPIIADFTTGAPKKRKRESLVCTNCKLKKIKCDRSQPCSQCKKSGKGESCKYNESALRQSNGNSKDTLPYLESIRRPLTFDSVSDQSIKAKQPKLNPKQKNSNRPSIIKSEANTLDEERARAVNDATELSLLKLKLKQIEQSMSRQSEKHTPKLHGTTSDNGLNTSQIEPTPNFTNKLSASNNPLYCAKYAGYDIPRNMKDTPPYSQNGQSFSTPKDGSYSTPGTTSSLLSMISDSSKFDVDEEVERVCGLNPYLAADDTINFYEGYSSVYIKEPQQRISFGPFSWSSLLQKDRALKILWDHTIKVKEAGASAAVIFAKDHHSDAEATSLLTNTTNETSTALDETGFKKRLLEPEGLVDMVPYRKLLKKAEGDKNQATKESNQGLALGISFIDGKLGRELRLIDKIKLILPNKRVVWSLVKIFFEDMYPFMPLLDEESFRQLLHKIIGPEEFKEENIETLNIEKRLDLAYIGTLLVIMRVSYLSVITDWETKNEVENGNVASEEYNYIFQNPIAINFIDIAQECLDQFSIFKKLSFPVLTLAFYMRLYHLYAPEDGSHADGDGSSAMLALIIKMAVSLGCNREPDYLPGSGPPSPLNNVIRRIWHYLVLNDLSICHTFGAPINIQRGSYDTKVPFLRPGEECLRDKELDRFITESLFSSSILYYSVRNIVHLVVDVEGRTRMLELCKHLSELELTLKREYNSLDACLNPPQEKFYKITRVFKSKFYISVKAFYVIIYFYFFMHYEPKDQNLTFFYLRKILLLVVGEMMPNDCNIFGKVSYDLIINPYFEQFIHKSNQVLISLIIRVNFAIYKMSKKMDHREMLNKDVAYSNYFRNMCNLSSALTSCLEIAISVISKISTRYYHAWRITKGHTFLLKVITSEEFYTNYLMSSEGICVNALNCEQLKDLVDICESTLSKLGKESHTSFPPASEIFHDTPLSKNTGGTPSNVPRSYMNTTPKRANVTEKLVLEVDTPRFDLGLVDSEEIDKIWMQVLSSKQQDDSPDLDKINEPYPEAATELDDLLLIPFESFFGI